MMQTKVQFKLLSQRMGRHCSLIISKISFVRGNNLVLRLALGDPCFARCLRRFNKQSKVHF